MPTYSDMDKSNLCQDGFTLIETLVAIAILSIGIMALTTLQSVAIQGNATANRISESTSWASDQAERIFAMRYDDLVDNDDDRDLGLNDVECCPNGNDPWGNLVVGCTKKSDHCVDQQNYGIYWNVMNGPVTEPVLDQTKTIRVIVTRKGTDSSKRVSFDYIKMKYMK